MKKVLIVLGAVFGLLSALLFVFTPQLGDQTLTLLYLYWGNLALQKEFAYPWFTPGFCGGFVLGGDPQGTILTIYQLFSWIFDDPRLGVILGDLVATLTLFLGMMGLLRRMGISDPFARGFGAVIAAFNGYWISHLKMAHVVVHGSAFIPPLLCLVHDRLFKPGTADTWRSKILWIVPASILIMLMVNSGHFWAQVAFPLGVGGCVALLGMKSCNAKSVKITRMNWVVIAFVFGIALSLYKIWSIARVGLYQFPRIVPVVGTIGSHRLLAKNLFLSLFWPGMVTHRMSSPLVGGWWEWTLYAGLVSLPLSIGGAYLYARDQFKQKPFRLRGLVTERNWLLVAMLVAGALQWMLTRGNGWPEFLRRFLPGFSNISYMYRGTYLFVFILAFATAYALSKLKKDWVKVAAVILVTADLALTYGLGGLYGDEFDPDTARWLKSAFSVPMVPKAERRIEHYVKIDDFKFDGKTGEITCYNPLLSYNGEKNHSRVVIGSSEALSSDGYFNTNDMRAIFTRNPEPGKYGREEWPRWSATEASEHSRFLSFHSIPSSTDVVQPLVRIAYWSSWIAWLGLAAAAIYIRLRRKA